MRHLTVRISPDFRAGAFIVAAWIIKISELIENLALAIRLHAHGQVARIFNAAAFGGE